MVTDQLNTSSISLARNDLSFPIYERDWSAMEELLLLEGVSMYGLGNWIEISRHVASKDPQRCELHYLAVYLESPQAPLPDPNCCLLRPANLSDASNASQSSTTLASSPDKGDSKLRINSNVAEDNNSVNPISAPQDVSSNQVAQKRVIGRMANIDLDTGRYELDTSGTVFVTALKGSAATEVSTASAVSASGSVRKLEGGEASIYLEDGDELTTGDEVVDRDGNLIGPVQSGITGYMPLRDDFDVEYDDDAEAVISDMEFREDEHPSETMLKLKILEIYNAKLDERERRKQFVKERGLLDYKRQLATERRRPREERDIRNQFRPFARFMSPDEWEELVDGLVAEQKLRKRIEQLQEYRRQGIRTLAEAQEYDKAKKRREPQLALAKQRDTASYLFDKNDGTGRAGDASLSRTPSASGRKRRSVSTRGRHAKVRQPDSPLSDYSPIKPAQRSASRGRPRGRPALTPRQSVQSNSNDGFPEPTYAPVNMQAAQKIQTTPVNQLRVSSAPGSKFLSEVEKRLCEHLQILPSQYDAIKQALIDASTARGYIRRDQAGAIVPGKITPSAMAGIFEFCVSCGWIRAEPNQSQRPPISRPENSFSSK